MTLAEVTGSKAAVDFIARRSSCCHCSSPLRLARSLATFTCRKDSDLLLSFLFLLTPTTPVDEVVQFFIVKAFVTFRVVLVTNQYQRIQFNKSNEEPTVASYIHRTCQRPNLYKLISQNQQVNFPKLQRRWNLTEVLLMHFHTIPKSKILEALNWYFPSCRFSNNNKSIS